MCLLIVGGRGAGMMWGAGMATLSGSNLSCLGFISSLFEIILFLIHSTQTSCPVLCPWVTLLLNFHYNTLCIPQKLHFWELFFLRDVACASWTQLIQSWQEMPCRGGDAQWLTAHWKAEIFLQFHQLLSVCPVGFAVWVWLVSARVSTSRLRGGTESCAGQMCAQEGGGTVPPCSGSAVWLSSIKEMEALTAVEGNCCSERSERSVLLLEADKAPWQMASEPALFIPRGILWGEGQLLSARNSFWKCFFPSLCYLFWHFVFNSLCSV